MKTEITKEDIFAILTAILYVASVITLFFIDYGILSLILSLFGATGGVAILIAVTMAHMMSYDSPEKSIRIAMMRMMSWCIFILSCYCEGFLIYLVIKNIIYLI